MSQTRISDSKGLLSTYGVLCLTLAFMVFAWGTNYKLSLYKAGHESSPAKVCTRGSDAVENALDRAAGGSVAAHAPLTIAVFLSRLQGIPDHRFDRLCDEAIIDLSPLSRAPILYLRPPPDRGRSFD
jgi:hypothetical protein